jgi:NAD(P)-dependent dehydrogenase (short-subunit alcohol dehydrogenase family)
MKTIATVGAGTGLGFAIARKFGRYGFRAALIARRRNALA